MPTRSHLWLRGSLGSDRAALLSTLDLPPALLPTINAHRRLRGPYTAAGALLRAVAPRALDLRPKLVRVHDIEILSVTPELRGAVPASRETLTTLAIPQERTRFFSRLRTLRLAHGLTEFLRDYLRALDGGPRLLVVDNVDRADATDQELLAVLLRRVDPALLTIVVGTGGDGVRGELATPLSRYTVRHDVPASPGTGPRAGTPEDDRELAARYVGSDGTADDPAVRAGYDRLKPAERARLHDRRATELEALGQVSLRLGAVPYHREHGGDPAGAGARALCFALDYCIDMGFYEATVDYGRRGRAVIDRVGEPALWWTFTTKMTTSLATLGRPEEAEQLYREARATSTNPQVHLQAAYATAMLYTRHHEDGRKDHEIAKGWINEAIAISALLPDSRERTFNTVFHQNGLALIEVHLKNLPEALRLVSSGMDRLNAAVGPTEHQLHRSVLRYNRAQVYVGMGRLDEALAEYTAVIEQDPNYAEYYFDRAAILRRLGRPTEALADYEQAIRLSPPYPEVYYNRGDTRVDLGDLDGALADFAYVLELDPDRLDAHINRAGLLCELGDADSARRHVDAGLALDPNSPHLLCLLGRLEMEAGHAERARQAFDAALASDPELGSAWANRGALAFDSGDLPAAVADLSRALDLSDDPAVRFNRATAYQASRCWAEAVDDLTRALSLGAEDAELFGRRGACLIELGDRDRARADLLRWVELDPDQAGEAARLMPELAGDPTGPGIGAHAV